jgi:peptidoglycan/LPS O-acetylase OafA/YrhL
MNRFRSTLKTIADPRFESTPSLLSPSYLPSLDGLRAISIAFVVAGHVLLYGPYGKYVSGTTGVHIFFAISGFLITTLLIKERIRTGDISLKRFYIRRVLRIFPVAYLYLLVLIFLNQVFQLHIGFLDFLTAFLYIKNMSVIHPTVVWPTVHYWSLSVEEQFYLLFPFLLVYQYKIFIRLFLPLFLIAPLATLYSYHGGKLLTGAPHLLLQSFVNIFGGGLVTILCGSLCAILVFKGIIPLAPLKRFRSLAPVVLFLVAVGHMSLETAIPGWQTLWLYLTGPLTCVGLLLSLQPGTWFYRLLNTKLFRQIGVLSYSLYIWQEIFTREQPWASSFRYGAAPWLNLPALLMTALISYHLFEKKFLRLKDRFKGAAKPTAQPGPSAPHSIAL